MWNVENVCFICNQGIPEVRANCRSSGGLWIGISGDAHHTKGKAGVKASDSYECFSPGKIKKFIFFFIFCKYELIYSFFLDNTG